MTERSRPWDGIVTGDAGPYSDDQWTDVWKTLLVPVVAREGVFRDQLNDLEASVAGAVSPVSINTGRALVDGIWYESDAAVTVAIATPAANPRVDRIVLRKDWAAQTVRLTRIAGAEAASPVPPAITQIDGTTWDLPLWQVHITTGGTLTINADERLFVGQYNPVGGSPTRIYFEDDFLESNDYANGDERRNWAAALDAAGQINIMVPDADIVCGGITFKYDGAGVGEKAELNTGRFGLGAMNADLEVRLKSPNTDANLDRLIGFLSTYSLTPTNGVFFRQEGAANWFGVTRSGGVETTVDLGVGATDTIKRLRFRMFGSDCVAFFVDDVFVGASRSDIPGSTTILLFIGILDDGGGTNVNDYMEVDWIRVQGDR